MPQGSSFHSARHSERSEEPPAFRLCRCLFFPKRAAGAPHDCHCFRRCLSSVVILTLSLSKGKDPEGLDSPQQPVSFQQPTPAVLAVACSSPNAQSKNPGLYLWESQDQARSGLLSVRLLLRGTPLPPTFGVKSFYSAIYRESSLQSRAVKWFTGKVVS